MMNMKIMEMKVLDDQIFEMIIRSFDVDYRLAVVIEEINLPPVGMYSNYFLTAPSKFRVLSFEEIKE